MPVHSYATPDPRKGFWEEGDETWEWSDDTPTATADTVCLNCGGYNDCFESCDASYRVDDTPAPLRTESDSVSVWIVRHNHCSDCGSYSGYNILGIFRTEEAAKVYAAKQETPARWGESISVHSYKVQ